VYSSFSSSLYAWLDKHVKDRVGVVDGLARVLPAAPCDPNDDFAFN
jgi:hypothetical protein